jgi:K+-sensing histidine kinase KdpD
MIGFLKVILKGMDGPINDMQKGDLTTALNGSQRMLVLINNLVEMARLNNGELTLKREEFNMAHLIEDVADRWKLLHAEFPVELNLSIVEPMFNVDTNYMRNVISNLLTYAAFRVTEGSISISASGDAAGMKAVIQSKGNKSRDKQEMDSAMLGFICASFIKLHGGTMEELQETEDGVALSFSLPR